MNPWVHRLQQAQSRRRPTPGGRSREAAVPPPADRIGDNPCPQCGSRDQWQTPARRWICRPCLLQGADAISALKVWIAVLDASVWVVADHLPRAAWPADAPVYTQAEVAVLRRVGPETLPSVHAVKQIFHAQVLDGHQGPAMPHRLRDLSGQGGPARPAGTVSPPPGG